MRGCQLHTLEVIYEELGLTRNFHPCPDITACYSTQSVFDNYRHLNVLSHTLVHLLSNFA
jgi:hypothetical protein